MFLIGINDLKKIFYVELLNFGLVVIKNLGKNVLFLCF